MSELPEGSYAELGDGLRIHYHESGTGFPVVFIHGSGPGASGYSNFSGNYRHFGDEGFRALVPDSLGYGYSSKPETARYDLQYLSTGILRFLDALRIDRAALVGNSLGGAMAIQCALDAPDRIQSLVLMAPGGLETRETYMEMVGIQTMMRSIYGKAGITVEGMKKTFALQVQDQSLVTDALVEQRYEVAKTQPRVVFDTMKVPQLDARLEALVCPVLGLWGAADNFCPVSGATTLARNVKDAQVTIFSNCGHWVMVERRDFFNAECVRFLKAHL